MNLKQKIELLEAGLKNPYISEDIKINIKKQIELLKSGNIPTSKFEIGDSVTIGDDQTVYEIKDKSYRDYKGDMSWLYYIPAYSSVNVAEEWLTKSEPKSEEKSQPSIDDLKKRLIIVKKMAAKDSKYNSRVKIIEKMIAKAEKEFNNLSFDKKKSVLDKNRYLSVTKNMKKVEDYKGYEIWVGESGDDYTVIGSAPDYTVFVVGLDDSKSTGKKTSSKTTLKDAKDYIDWVTEGKNKSKSAKLFSVNPSAIGKAKYSINFYDGGTHKDGSPFIGIDTFSSKKALDIAIKKYKDNGFLEVDSVFNELHSKSKSNEISDEEFIDSLIEKALKNREDKYKDSGYEDYLTAKEKNAKKVGIKSMIAKLISSGIPRDIITKMIIGFKIETDGEIQGEYSMDLFGYREDYYGELSDRFIKYYNDNLFLSGFKYLSIDKSKLKDIGFDFKSVVKVNRTNFKGEEVFDSFDVWISKTGKTILTFDEGSSGEGGYSGLVSTDIEEGYDLTKEIVDRASYIKDLDVFFNGLGGMDVENSLKILSKDDEKAEFDKDFEEVFNKYNDKNYFDEKGQIETAIRNWKKFADKGDENALKYSEEDIIKVTKEANKARNYLNSFVPLKKAIEEGDKDFIKSRVRYDQKFGKELYEKLTGEKLPNTNKALLDYFDKKFDGGKSDELVWFTKEALEFVPPHQLSIIKKSKESFQDSIKTINKAVAEMPSTYGTDGVKDKTVYLHYFSSSADWYIVEKDASASEDGHLQDFGYADLGYGAELGYISVDELKSIPQVELDLYFEPKKWSEINKEKGGYTYANGGDVSVYGSNGRYFLKRSGATYGEPYNTKKEAEQWARLVNKGEYKLTNQGVEYIEEKDRLSKIGSTYAKGGDVNEKFEVELHWKGLSKDRTIGVYVITEKTLDEIESQWSHILSVDVLDSSDKKAISWFNLKKELFDKGREKGFFKKGGSTYAEGGIIPSPYKGMTPKQIWDSWNNDIKQRFLFDKTFDIFKLEQRINFSPEKRFTEKKGDSIERKMHPLDYIKKVKEFSKYTLPKPLDLVIQNHAFDRREIGLFEQGGSTYAKGGNLDDEYVDLFEDYEKQPDNLRAIVSKYEDKFEDGMDYSDTEQFLEEVEAKGYTFDYGLDNEPYDLRPIGTKGKSELEDNDSDGYFAKGGEVAQYPLDFSRSEAEKLFKLAHKNSEIGGRVWKSFLRTPLPLIYKNLSDRGIKFANGGEVDEFLRLAKLGVIESNDEEGNDDIQRIDNPEEFAEENDLDFIPPLLINDDHAKLVKYLDDFSTWKQGSPYSVENKFKVELVSNDGSETYEIWGESEEDVRNDIVAYLPDELAVEITQINAKGGSLEFSDLLGKDVTELSYLKERGYDDGVNVVFEFKDESVGGIEASQAYKDEAGKSYKDGLKIGIAYFIGFDSDSDVLSLTKENLDDIINNFSSKDKIILYTNAGVDLHSSAKGKYKNIKVVKVPFSKFKK